MKATVNRFSIELVQDEIYMLPVQAVVTVTDTNLTPSADLLASAGDILQTEIVELGWREVGSAALTSAGRLPHAQHIIHAVAPRWGEGSERGKLANVTWSCLWLAHDHKLASIALPAISVGVLGYPVEACAQIMISRVIDFTFESTKHLRQILFCLNKEPVFAVFAAEFKRQIDHLLATGEGSVHV